MEQLHFHKSHIMQVHIFFACLFFQALLTTENVEKTTSNNLHSTLLEYTSTAFQCYRMIWCHLTYCVNVYYYAVSQLMVRLSEGAVTIQSCSEKMAFGNQQNKSKT